MFADIIIPMKMGLKSLLGFIVSSKFKPVNHFTLNNTVKSLDVCIFFRRGNVCELLDGLLAAEVLLYIICNKLRAIIIANDDAFDSILPVNFSQAVNYIHFSYATLKNLF